MDPIKNDQISEIFPTQNLSTKISGAVLTHGILSPMRDGTLLSNDLIRPETPGSYPAIIMRTPYDKTKSRSNQLLHALAERGYVVVIQDTRGRYNSDGTFFPYRDDRKDGYDTVEWVARQDWCDGNVGMYGGSYAGQTQWFAAADAPPHLKAIVPLVSPPDAFFNEPISHGCFLLPCAEWMLYMGRKTSQLTPSHEIYNSPQSYFDALPINAVEELVGIESSWWKEWMLHPNLDDFWRESSYQDAWPKIEVAALNITGWWDMNFPGSPSNFIGMRRQGKSEHIRHSQQLVIGPWPHWGNREQTLNDVDFGNAAIVNLNDYIVRFYDHWLKGLSNGLEKDPRVQVFVHGVNEWWAADTWPLPETDFIPYFFHSGGRANSLKGDGKLSITSPTTEPADSYLYDPADPVGAFWNMRDGPVDDRLPSLRDDMLCYTSDAVIEPIDVVGPVTCVLYGSSSALDTDWHVRLVDVHRDGSARFLCHGVLRARFRELYEHPKLLEPNRVYQFTLNMDACGVRFLPGHRIRVEVMSSWFPRYERNTNSGEENNFLAQKVVVAHNCIFHDAIHPSHIVLPIARKRRAILPI